MRYASLLRKVFRGDEELDMQEWMLITELGLHLVKWLSENSSLEVTPISSQVHLQPSKKIKKKTSKKHRNE